MLNESGPTIILVNDTDHLSYPHASTIFGILNGYEIPFTHAVFCTLEVDDEYPSDPKSLAKHCRPVETAGIIGKYSEQYISLLRHQVSLGNEIAYHGYSQISNKRDKFLEGIDTINSKLGIQMSTYIEHGGSPYLHPIAGCKRETLAIDGKNQDTDYYVDDLIRSNFKQAWCYFDLVNTRNDFKIEQLISSLGTPIFYERDGITMMKRHRAKDAAALLQSGKLKEDDVIIAYTHFGYRGYGQGTLLESWSTVTDINRNCLFLSKLRQSGCKLTTVQNYCKEKKND